MWNAFTHTYVHIFLKNDGAGETVQWFRVFVALAEVLSLVLRWVDYNHL